MIRGESPTAPGSDVIPTCLMRISLLRAVLKAASSHFQVDLTF